MLRNRDLRAHDVPALRFADLPSDQADGRVTANHARAWDSLWRSAVTFDPAHYAAGTGDRTPPATYLADARRAFEQDGTLEGRPLSALRAALHALYDGVAEYGAVSAPDGELADGLLDAIYRDVASGASPRPTERPGPPERELGVFAGKVEGGSGQHRFWFKSALERPALYDKVAGVLLREVGPDVVVSALYLYPPQYLAVEAAPPWASHVFQLLLEPRGRAAGTELEHDYERLIFAVRAALGDVASDWGP